MQAALVELRSVFCDPVFLFGWSQALLCILSARSLRFGRIWVGYLILTVVYFLAASPVSANFLVDRFERTARSEAAKCGLPPNDTVFIVLAGGASRAVYDARNFGRLHEPSFRRLIAAVDIFRTVPGSSLLLSGGSPSGGVAEAELMASMAKALGVPAARISVEDFSTNTLESAREVKRMLGSDTRPKYLVTSALHMPRALAAFRSTGLGLCALPVDFQHVETDWDEIFEPQSSALTKTAAVLHEALGHVAYTVSKRI